MTITELLSLSVQNPLRGTVLKSTEYFISVSHEHENTPAQRNNHLQGTTENWCSFAAWGTQGKQVLVKGRAQGTGMDLKDSQKHQPQRSTDMRANHSQRLPVTQKFLNTTILLPPPLARAPAADSSCHPHSPGLGKCYGVQ